MGVASVPLADGLVSPLVRLQSSVPLVPTLERISSQRTLVSKCNLLKNVLCGELTASSQLDQHTTISYGRELQTEAKGTRLCGPPPFQWSCVHDLQYRLKGTSVRMCREEPYLRGV